MDYIHTIEEIEKIVARGLPSEVLDHLNKALSLLQQANFIPKSYRTINGVEYFDIPGYEERYKISADGDVYSLRAKRVLKPWESSAGRKYLRVDLRDNEGKYKKPHLHDLVLAAFCGPKPNGAQVLHFDDNPTNNKIGNLRYGSASENTSDAIRNQRHRAKFSREERDKIYMQHLNGATISDLTQEHNCSMRTINKVLSESYHEDR